jgi:hypothetical protein
MNELTISAAVLLGLLLRFGIPIIITFGLAKFLRSLDERWRAEAAAEEAQAKYKAQQAALLQMWIQQPCWEINNCSYEQRGQCKAFHQKEIPCWEIFRSNGNVNQRCQSCEYKKTLSETLIMN